MPDPVLQVSPDLALPLTIVVHRMAFMGTYHSGKTYGASKVAELMWEAGLQWVALDSLGIWWGMRLLADGSPGFPIAIFGGKHGDIEIHPGDGALVADIVHGEGISAIVDISMWRNRDHRVRFATDFAKRIYDLRQDAPAAIHIFLEEAHEYLPQRSARDDVDMLFAFNQLWSQGGNFGIGGSLISQRPQKVDKEALELSSVVFAFNITGILAYKAMRTWMEGMPEAERLPKLQPGECLVWSPSLLHLKVFTKTSPKVTFHARFDPNQALEQVAIANRALAPIAAEALRARFAKAEVGEEKSEITSVPQPLTPTSAIGKGEKFVQTSEQKHWIKIATSLQDELVSLRKQVAGHIPLEGRNKHLETENMRLIRTLDQAQAERDTYQRFFNEMTSHVDAISKLTVNVGHEIGILDGDGKPYEPMEIPSDLKPDAKPDPVVHVKHSPSPVKPKGGSRVPNLPSDGPAAFAHLNAQQLKILAAISEFPEGISRRALAAYVGLQPDADHFGGMLRILIEIGLVLDDPLRLAKPDQYPPGQQQTKNLEDIQEMWIQRIGSRGGQLIRVLIDTPTHRLSTRTISTIFGISPEGGYFKRILSALKEQGITREEKKGGEKFVILTDFLFPEELS